MSQPGVSFAAARWTQFLHPRIRSCTKRTTTCSAQSPTSFACFDLRYAAEGRWSFRGPTATGGMIRGSTGDSGIAVAGLTALNGDERAAESENSAKSLISMVGAQGLEPWTR